MYKEQKKILLAGYKKSRTWLFIGNNTEDMLKVAEGFARWLTGAQSASGDILQIHEDSIKISHARKINNFLKLTPSTATQKVIIISGFKSITHSTSNALLKTFEESYQHAQIIIIAKNINLILPTIRSRSFILRFPSSDAITQNNPETLYKNLLHSLITKSYFKKKLDENELQHLISYAFRRILLYHHHLITPDSQQERLFFDSGSQLFWHSRWIDACKILLTKRELNLQKEQLLHFCFSPYEIIDPTL